MNSDPPRMYSAGGSEFRLSLSEFKLRFRDCVKCACESLPRGRLSGYSDSPGMNSDSPGMNSDSPGMNSDSPERVRCLPHERERERVFSLPISLSLSGESLSPEMPPAVRRARQFGGIINRYKWRMGWLKIIRKIDDQIAIIKSLSIGNCKL